MSDPARRVQLPESPGVGHGLVSPVVLFLWSTVTPAGHPYLLFHRRRLETELGAQAGGAAPPLQQELIGSADAQLIHLFPKTLVCDGQQVT